MMPKVITFQPQPYNEPVMIEGYGAQPVPPPKYVPANDNVPVVEVRSTTGGSTSALRARRHKVTG
jgi:hypothetical protein